MKNVDWTNVESSNVEAVAWEDETLYVKFLNGTYYKYNGVSQEVYNNLVTADSVGKFLNQNIKGVFSYEKIDYTGEKGEKANEHEVA